METVLKRIMRENRETVSFSRKEFIDFLEWVGVNGENAITDSGQESFILYGNMGNTFTLECIRK